MAGLGEFFANFAVGALDEAKKNREKQREVHTKVMEKVLEDKIKQGNPAQIMQQILLAKQLNPDLDLSKVSIKGGKVGFDLASPKGGKQKTIPSQSRSWLDKIDSELINLQTAPPPSPGAFDWMTGASQKAQQQSESRKQSLLLQRKHLVSELETGGFPVDEFRNPPAMDIGEDTGLSRQPTSFQQQLQQKHPGLVFQKVTNGNR